MFTMKDIIFRSAAEIAKEKQFIDNGYNPVRYRPKIHPLTEKTFFLTMCVHDNAGYDWLARHIIRGFQQGNINFRINASCHADEFRQYVMPKPEKNWELIIKTPPHFKNFNPTKKSILMAMWECDKLQSEWVEAMNKAAFILTPSNWSKNNFIRDGITIPIYVLPLGYDPLSFYIQDKFSLSTFDINPPQIKEKEPFTLGCAAALGEGGIRKNIPYTIQCFKKAFPNVNDVKLKIKVSPRDHLMAGDSRIEVINAKLTMNELNSWYNSLDCYVHLSAAEGWGFHCLESMAVGVPLISTTYSSLADFFSCEEGLVIDYDEIEVNNNIYQGKQCHPKEDSVIEAMQYAYNNREEMKILGGNGRIRSRNFKWADFGRRLLNILNKEQVVDYISCAKNIEP